MRKAFLLFFTVFIFLFAKSQIKYGVKAGATINSQTPFRDVDKKNLVAGQASIFGIISLNKFFTLQPSVGYYPKGVRIANLTFEDQLGNPIGSGTLNYRFDYIELSAPFQFLITNATIKLSAGLGPYFSYAISGKEIWKNISGNPSNEPTKGNIPFGNNGYKRFDIGFGGLLSAQIQSKWMISVNYEIGVDNISSYSTDKVHNLSAGVTLGYFFK